MTELFLGFTGRSVRQGSRVLCPDHLVPVINRLSVLRLLTSYMERSPLLQANIRGLELAMLFFVPTVSVRKIEKRKKKKRKKNNCRASTRKPVQLFTSALCSFFFFSQCTFWQEQSLKKKKERKNRTEQKTQNVPHA